MTAKCKLDFGRVQELKPFFLLNSYVFQRPFSHVLALQCKSDYFASAPIGTAE